MLRAVGIGSVLLFAQFARAQSTLEVYATDDQTYRLSMVDQAGKSTGCTVRTDPRGGGGCHLSLSPGALQLHLTSNDRSLDELLSLPAGPSGLELKYRSQAMGWVGVGLLGGGVLESLLGIVFLSADTVSIAANSGTDPNTVRNEYVALAAVSFVSAAALFVAGGILTGIGFHRAGPHADLTPAADAPPAYPPPPPAYLPPPPPSAPPVIWEGAPTRSDT